jgi:protein O-GlcNAc transferase
MSLANANPQALSYAIEASQRQTQGRIAEAIDLYRRALAIEPKLAEVHNNLGAAYQSVKRQEEARDAFAQAIVLKPEFAEAHNNLGNALKALGQNDAAVESYRNAIALNPTFAPAEFNLGNTLQAVGNMADAEGAFRRALKIKPNYPKCENNLGNVLKALGRLDEAVEAYQRAIKLQPKYANAEYNLGTVYQAQGKLDEAVAAYRRALGYEPEFQEALRNLGAALHANGRSDQAVDFYQQALLKNPNSAEAENNLGAALAELGKMTEAIDAYRRALAIKPKFVEALSNVGNVYKDSGRLEEAMTSYEQAMELAPKFVAGTSNWCFCEQYRPGVTLERLQAAHDVWDRRHGDALKASWKPWPNSRDPERPIRIGFVSSDLGHHPVGYLLTRIFDALDLKQFPTYCYSHRARKDELTYRLQRKVTEWRDVQAIDDNELAEQVRRDEIDILFDLNGHTAGNRLQALARKPAPIQASWIGYVGPCGLSAVEYLVADRWLVSDEMLPRFREKVIRLPTVWASFQAPIDAPEVAPSPVQQRGKITFGSFNNPAKLTPEVIATWSEILNAVGDSRLILKFRGLSDTGVQAYFHRLFKQHGVDPARVEFQGVSPFKEMLELYNSTIDIALDPFPFNGGTTTMIALWMGVPVVTMPCDTLPGRQSYALLKTLGVDETIGMNRAEYVQRAVALATHHERLVDLRAHLRPTFAASPVCDGARLAREFMVGLREAWRERVTRPW